jgi:hypothetical protein
MKWKGQSAIALTVISLVLIVAQALVWAHFTHRAGSAMNEANLASEHPPTEMPGLAGLTLLFVAGVLASLPQGPE